MFPLTDNPPPNSRLQRTRMRAPLSRKPLGGLAEYGRERILSRPSIDLMTMDHLTPEQKAASPFFADFWNDRGWGFGLEHGVGSDSPSVASLGPLALLARRAAENGSFRHASKAIARLHPETSG